jgi:2-polyprenyl-3-methyl-5-hydroxy-6-metoxy-1,4-benzoquinol methylase
MFGESVDYQLLRLFAHERNRATEDELDRQAGASGFRLDDARAYLERVRGEFFDGHLPVDPRLSYLDIGCGMGRLSLGLALAGARDVTGLDIVPRNIEQAQALSELLDPPSRPSFVNIDIHDWKPQRGYDVLFVLGAMEHIHDPRTFLAELPRLLKPEGRAFVSHEPFQSPIGDHMREFFRVQIPWRGLLFSERAILRLRREFYRPTDPAMRFQDIVGGLNLMSFRQYVRWAHEAGLDFVRHSFNPQLKHQRRFRPLHPISWVLTRIPGVQDYFIVNAYSILRRRPEGQVRVS